MSARPTGGPPGRCCTVAHIKIKKNRQGSSIDTRHYTGNSFHAKVRSHRCRLRAHDSRQFTTDGMTIQTMPKHILVALTPWRRRPLPRGATSGRRRTPHTRGPHTRGRSTRPSHPGRHSSCQHQPVSEAAAAHYPLHQSRRPFHQASFHSIRYRIRSACSYTDTRSRPKPACHL